MSINWVMKSPDGAFVKLPNERVLHTSPPRTSLDISAPNKFPGTLPFSLKSDAGLVYLTNQRIVYIPASPTVDLQSFSSPILNLQDTYVRAPFFGANYWTALCKPVSGGGIPPAHPSVELRMTFREGGAYDFHSKFEQIKERLYQAYMVARESGQRGQAGADLTNVDLEPLPAYEPARDVATEEPREGEHRDSGVEGIRRLDNTEQPKPEEFAAPNEPPPGYEEAQIQAVGIDLDQRLRNEAESRRASVVDDHEDRD